MHACRAYYCFVFPYDRIHIFLDLQWLLFHTCNQCLVLYKTDIKRLMMEDGTILLSPLHSASLLLLQPTDSKGRATAYGKVAFGENIQFAQFDIVFDDNCKVNHEYVTS